MCMCGVGEDGLILLIPMLIPADGERMTEAPEDYSSLVLLNNLCQEIRIRIANAFAKRREGGDFYLETDTEGKW